MGAAMGGLPKAVESINIERHVGPLFRVGMAEMNGWRPSMEDSHVVVMRDSWGFFGVFDGHGGSACSAFVAKRLTEQLQAVEHIPKDNAAVKSMMLAIDRDFLDLRQPSGSTGTFVLVEHGAGKAKSTEAGAAAEGAETAAANGEPKKEVRHLIRVGNIGDSRVLLGNMNGKIVEGPGTDAGLTTDHKPDYPSERERIERTGGTVQMVQGVARVNGDLAVSRAFGDAQYKETGGPRQEDHPVSAEPEFTTTTAGPGEFVVLVCDGISENNFPNREVIELVADGLVEAASAEGGKEADLGKVAADVCKRALERGSTDNLSCMILLLDGTPVSAVNREHVPGAFVAPEHNLFRKAYQTMAERAGCTLVESVEKRYDVMRTGRLQAVQDAGAGEDAWPIREAPLADLRAELAKFGEGPPAEAEVGSEQRRRWFQSWLDGHDVEPPMDLANMSRAQLMQALSRDPDMLAAARSQGIIQPGQCRTVQVLPLAKLKPSVEDHPALKWDERLTAICGKRGRVLQDDASDGTSQVQFPQPLTATAWLPTSSLVDVDQDEGNQRVRVACEAKLRPAVEAHEALRWYPTMSTLCEHIGRVVDVDESDGTTRVSFPPPLSVKAWLPSVTLTQLDDDEDDEASSIRDVVAPGPVELKAAVVDNPALQWQDRLTTVCGLRGRVLEEDEQDGTSKVLFPGSDTGGAVWLPTDILRTADPESADLDGPGTPPVEDGVDGIPDDDDSDSGDQPTDQAVPTAEVEAGDSATSNGVGEEDQDAKRRKVDG